jgi:hypothetical protein
MVGTPRRPASWLVDLPRRARLEAGARSAFPTLRYQRRQHRQLGPVHVYNLELDIPGYERRRVTVEFRERYW